MLVALQLLSERKVLIKFSQARFGSTRGPFPQPPYQPSSAPPPCSDPPWKQRRAHGSLVRSRAGSNCCQRLSILMCDSNNNYIYIGLIYELNTNGVSICFTRIQTRQSLFGTRWVSLVLSHISHNALGCARSLPSLILQNAPFLILLHNLSSLTTKHLSSFILPHISPPTINRLPYPMLSHVWPHTHIKFPHSQYLYRPPNLSTLPYAPIRHNLHGIACIRSHVRRHTSS